MSPEDREDRDDELGPEERAADELWKRITAYDGPDELDVSDELDALARCVHRDPGELMGLFTKFITTARAVRRLGSAALDLCYVAAGRFDGFWEQKLHPWDVAGGALIVQEAGGRVTAIDGAPYRSRGGSVLATNGHVHDEMLTTIRDFRREWAGSARG